jgi:hypothetical protein
VQTHENRSHQSDHTFAAFIHRSIVLFSPCVRHRQSATLLFRMPHWIGLVLQILQGLLTPVIAVMAVYIAYQQWKVGERKFEFDHYERRVQIFREVRAILILVLRDFNPDFMELQKFSAATAEADFLFGSEIPVYLDEILKRGWALRSAHMDYRDFTQPPVPGYDHAKVVSEMHEQEVWFTNQIATGAAKENFKKYLSVSR